MIHPRRDPLSVLCMVLLCACGDGAAQPVPPSEPAPADADPTRETASDVRETDRGPVRGTRVRDVRRAGAHGVAVIGAVLTRDDVAAATAEVLGALMS